MLMIFKQMLLFSMVAAGFASCSAEISAAPFQDDEQETDGRRAKVTVVSPQGATVAEYVQALKKMSSRLNMVVTDTAGRVRLPAIQLDQIPAESALYCLMQISEGEIIIEDDEYGADIMYVRRDPGFDSDSIVHVLNVENLLTQNDEKQLLTAIEIGLQLLSGESSKVQLKLHTESRLLFAKGTQKETRLIDNIVSEMQKSSWVPTRKESPPTDR